MASDQGASTTLRQRKPAGDAHDAAVIASANVPVRARGKAQRLKHSLDSFHDLPDYLRDNEFILGSYRREQSIFESARTLFGIHNETGNVWTHLLGFLLFVALAIYVAKHPPTPLAMTSTQLEQLWGSWQHHFAHLRASVDGEGVERLLASVHDKLAALGHGMAALEDAVAAGVQHGVHEVSGSLAALQHSLGDSLSSLGDSLGDGLQALEGHVAAGVQQVLGGGAAAAPAASGRTDLLGSVGGGLSDLSHRLSSGAAALGHNLAAHADAAAAHLGQGLSELSKDLGQGLSAAAVCGEGCQARLAVLTARLEGSLRSTLHTTLQWPAPRWPLYVYFAGACTCLLTSTLCHLLGCCARHVSEVVWRFDYSGIALLIVASFVPAIHYSFLCQPFWRTFYIGSTALMGVVVIALTMPSYFQQPRFRTLRALTFVALGSWGIVPVLHQLIHNWSVWAVRTAFAMDLLMGAVYLLGATIYSLRIPERWMPGKFDIAGHSHQLWHVAVVVAAYTHYRAVMVLLRWRDASGGCALQLHEPLLHGGGRGGGAPGGGGGGGGTGGAGAGVGGLGEEWLRIEQVWHSLSMQLHQYVGVPLVHEGGGGAGGAQA